MLDHINSFLVGLEVVFTPLGLAVALVCCGHISGVVMWVRLTGRGERMAGDGQ